MALQYALRVDYNLALYPALIAFFSKYATEYFAVEEGSSSDNWHVHCIFTSDKKQTTIRKAIQQFATGNGAYSFKQCDHDIDAYMRYMCKGAAHNVPPVIWGYCGLRYTRTAIAAWHQAYWEVNAAYEANSSKRIKLEKFKGNMVERLEAICKDKGIRAYEREDIAMQYISICVQARKPINVFAAKAVVNTVSAVLDEDSTSTVETRNIAQSIAAL